MDGFLNYDNNKNLFINTAVASKYPLKIFMKFFIFNNVNFKIVFVNTAVAAKYPLKCHCAQSLGNLHFKRRKNVGASTSLATVCQ